jgi:seryl-tRNA synthetase
LSVKIRKRRCIIIKEIRTDFDYFKNQLKSRNIDVDIDKIKELDETNRKYIQKKEALESEKKDISKSKDETLFQRSKEISKEL